MWAKVSHDQDREDLAHRGGMLRPVLPVIGQPMTLLIERLCPRNDFFSCSLHFL